MKKRLLPLIMFAGLVCSPIYALPNEEPVLQREDMQSFIDEVSKKHNFSRAQLESWFKDTKIKPEIIAAITRPYEAQPWHRYKKLFVTDTHIKNGVAFWKENAKTLERAQAKFGIPPEIIVAIIGVETRYGKYKGSHSVLDALSTLAFTYPKRSSFFKKELEQFLLLVTEQGLDPTTMVGSYAGAIGVPQFISSSYRRYAVDFSGNGQSDLINNIEDAIGSVANYFAVHGWKPNEPVAVQAKLNTNKKQIDKLEQSARNPKPIYSLTELKKNGIETKVPFKQKDEKFAVLSFDETEGKDYWLGLNNFYVITRYNHSHHYAMAVFQLSEKLKEAYSKT